MRRYPGHVLLCSWLIVCTAFVAPALAQDKAAAESAFRDGRKLMDAGKFAEACDKFAVSYRLDATVGTLLNLADCHVRIGKLATAWAEFTEVAERARDAGRSGHEAEGKRRAAELEPRLMRLMVTVGGEPPSGLVVTRGNRDMTALLGTSIAIDPGEYVLTATAPGHVAWTKTVRVEGEGQTIAVEIPPLAPAPEPEPAGTTPEPGTGTTVPGSGSQPGIPEDQADPGRSRRRLGLVVAGVGLAATATGLVFGVRARSLWDDSRDQCDESNACSQEGYDTVLRAQTSARTATVLVGAGVAAAAVGTVLFFTAPRPSDRAHARIAPSAGPGHIGVVMTGRF